MEFVGAEEVALLVCARLRELTQTEEAVGTAIQTLDMLFAQLDLLIDGAKADRLALERRITELEARCALLTAENEALCAAEHFSPPVFVPMTPGSASPYQLDHFYDESCARRPSPQRSEAGTQVTMPVARVTKGSDTDTESAAEWWTSEPQPAVVPNVILKKYDAPVYMEDWYNSSPACEEGVCASLVYRPLPPARSASTASSDRPRTRVRTLVRQLRSSLLRHTFDK